MNSKRRSANSRRITIRRVPLSLRYTSHSAYMANSRILLGVFFVPRFAHSCRLKVASDAQVASTGRFLPDAWSCREGSIILSAGKETFESLGLPGTKISARMPGAPEQHRMSASYDLSFLLYPNPTAGSDQHLIGHTERERSEQRFHP